MDVRRIDLVTRRYRELQGLRVCAFGIYLMGVSWIATLVPLDRFLWFVAPTLLMLPWAFATHRWCNQYHLPQIRARKTCRFRRLDAKRGDYRHCGRDRYANRFARWRRCGSARHALPDARGLARVALPARLASSPISRHRRLWRPRREHRVRRCTTFAPGATLDSHCLLSGFLLDRSVSDRDWSARPPAARSHAGRRWRCAGRP